MWFLKKFRSAYLFQIAWEKSCDYVLIIYMKKYEIAYIIMQKQSMHIKCKIIYSNLASNIVRSVKTTLYNQNNNTQWYFRIFEAQKRFIVWLKSSRNCSVWFALNYLKTVFSVYLNQSELSNFSMYLIRKVPIKCMCIRSRKIIPVSNLWQIKYRKHPKIKKISIPVWIAECIISDAIR